MRTRTLFILSMCLGLFSTAGCASRFQDMLRDRDTEIRDLEGELSDSRAENERLRGEVSDLQGRLSNAPAEPVGDAELARLQSELPDLQVSRRFGRIAIEVENTVTFDSGSTQLKSSASSVLRRVASVLERDYSGHRIYVAGHTDVDPIKVTAKKFRDNMHLSAERADAVAKWLVGPGGLRENRVAIIGYGSFDPVDSGAGDAAKARNRRVEIVVGEQLVAD